MCAASSASLPPGLQINPQVAQPDLALDRAHALALIPVSRETATRLDRFVAVLLEWQRRMNLIASSTEATVWTRHVADSLQLIALAPEARTWVDLGSGAGFPGLAIACALADTAGACVHLVESSTKKAAFLREAVRATAAPAVVHAVRIDDFVAKVSDPVDVVAARALAPLPRLLTAAYPLLKKGAKGVFPKGQDVAAELTETAKCWNIQTTLAPSRTEPSSRIVVVHSIEPRI
jgi:16S rRNA (guanine527-N7)-methyltransferase